MSRKILMSFLSLALASCSALPSNQVAINGSASFDQVNTSAVSQYEREMLAKSLANPYANSVADVDNSYKSLSLAKENAKFGVKVAPTSSSTIASDERAVIVKVGTVYYTLSESFMAKLRAFTLTGSGYDKVADPSLVVLPATVAGGAELTTTAFARLSAKSGAGVAVDNVAPSGIAPAYTSAYTLTASEASFVALMKTYKSVSMPDYFGTDDTTAANTPAVSPALPITRADGLFFIINTTGVRDAFYQAVDTAVTTVDPAPSTTTSTSTSLLSAAEITTLNTDYDGATTTAVTSAAEKTFLSTIVSANPYAKGVLLLDPTTGNIVSNNVSLYYGDADLPATNPTTTAFISTDVKGLLLANYGKLSRVNQTFPLVAPSNVQPLDTTNYSGAAAVVATTILTEPAATVATANPLAALYTAAGGGALNGPALTGNSIATYVYSDLHNVERAVHMGYSPVGTPIAPITTSTATALNTAPAIATLSFGPLTAPIAAATPAFSSTFSAAELKTLGTALGGAGLTLTKIGKTTAATLKNKAGILSYIATTLTAGSVPTFIVPCTRATTGAITLSTAGTHYVVITAVPNLTVPGTYDFFIVDTGYNSASGLGYSFLGNSGATATSPLNAVVSGLYNYAGTVVGATR